MNTIVKEDIKEMENVLQNVLSPFTDINIKYEAWRLVEEEGWHKQIKNKEKNKMIDELITYDMLKASLKFANVPFRDIWDENQQLYIISFWGVNDTFLFYFHADGTLFSIDNYD